MNLPQRDVAQVDQVRLVFGWHGQQLDSVEELQVDMVRYDRGAEPKMHQKHTWMPSSEDTPIKRKTP